MDAAVAATVFVAPALALGAAATGLRDLRGFAAAVAGAALGAWGSRFSLPVGGEGLQEASEAPGSASVVRAGALLAASGAVLAAGRWRRARSGGVRRPPRDPPSLSAVKVGSALGPVPRSGRGDVRDPGGPVHPRGAPRGERSAWLDQRALTPVGTSARLDARCLTEALTLLTGPAADDEGPQADLDGARVALLGVLTPDRAAALRDGGLEAVDRVTAFPAGAALVEDWLLASVEPGARLGGDHVDLSSLEGYDLVRSRRPSEPSSPPAGSAALPWTGRREARGPAVDRPLMASAIQAPLLAVDGLRGTAVGITGPGTIRANRPRALGWLGVRPDERLRASSRVAAARLDRPSPGDQPLAFLRRHADAQRASSPFETEGSASRSPRTRSRPCATTSSAGSRRASGR